MDQVQIHVASWSLTLLLFIISVVLLKTDKMKPQKIFHMILRLFYLITLATGIGIVVSYNFMGAALIKGALAILLMIFMEMILVKTRDHEKITLLWVLFFIDIILVFIYGYAVI